MDEDQNSEDIEATPRDQEPAVESSETPVENPASEGSHEPDEKQERNWKEARRKQRESDIRLKAQDEMIERLLTVQNQPPVQQQAPAPDELDQIAPDDFPTWGQTNKRIERTAEAIAEKKYREMEANREKSRFLERLQSKYSDFADVVNPDSIAILEEKDPELAATIAELKDPYKMGLQTYKFLKVMNLGGEAAESRHAKEVEKKLEKNEKSVQSPQVYNKRPMAQAFQSSEAEMSKLYEEMMGYAGQAN